MLKKKRQLTMLASKCINNSKLGHNCQCCSTETALGRNLIFVVIVIIVTCTACKSINCSINHNGHVSRWMSCVCACQVGITFTRGKRKLQHWSSLCLEHSVNVHWCLSSLLLLFNGVAICAILDNLTGRNRCCSLLGFFLCSFLCGFLERFLALLFTSLLGLRSLLLRITVLPREWQHVEEGCPCNWQKRKQDTIAPLLAVERSSFKRIAAKLHNQDLNRKREEPNRNKDPMCGKPCKNVELTTQFATVELIHQRTQNKNVEDHRLVLVGERVECTDGLLSVKPGGSDVQNEKQCHCLEYDLGTDAADHECGDQGLIPIVWLELEQLFCRFLSRKSKSCKRIHDKVNPEELYRLQRRVLSTSLFIGQDGNEKNQNGCKVNSQLKLEKLSNVIENASAPLDCIHNGCKVVIEKNNGRGFLCHLGTTQAHCKANISLLERRTVIDSITSHSNNLTK
eukprot:m.353532 g.353532  ORF g.353532 m.353532 type:complete len:454 (-) comp16786_c0_seq1:2699-4060(-)